VVFDGRLVYMPCRGEIAMDDDIETTEANIKKGLAEGMERDADRITRDDQLIRDYN
jgi:hypothetical protein